MNAQSLFAAAKTCSSRRQPLRRPRTCSCTRSTIGLQYRQGCSISVTAGTDRKRGPPPTRNGFCLGSTNLGAGILHPVDVDVRACGTPGPKAVLPCGRHRHQCAMEAPSRGLSTDAATTSTGPPLSKSSGAEKSGASDEAGSSGRAAVDVVGDDSVVGVGGPTTSTGRATMGKRDRLYSELSTALDRARVATNAANAAIASIRRGGGTSDYDDPSRPPTVGVDGLAEAMQEANVLLALTSRPRFLHAWSELRNDEYGDGGDSSSPAKKMNILSLPASESRNQLDCANLHVSFISVIRWCLLASASTGREAYNGPDTAHRHWGFPSNSQQPKLLVRKALELTIRGEKLGLPPHIPLYSQVSSACGVHLSPRSVLDASASLQRALFPARLGNALPHFFEPTLTAMARLKMYKEVLEVMKGVREEHSVESSAGLAEALILILGEDKMIATNQSDSIYKAELLLRLRRTKGFRRIEQRENASPSHVMEQMYALLRTYEQMESDEEDSDSDDDDDDSDEDDDWDSDDQYDEYDSDGTCFDANDWEDEDDEIDCIADESNVGPLSDESVSQHSSKPICHIEDAAPGNEPHVSVSALFADRSSLRKGKTVGFSAELDLLSGKTRRKKPNPNIYVRDSASWMLPDLCERLSELNDGNELMYTEAYEQVVLREMMSGCEDDDDLMS